MSHASGFSDDPNTRRRAEAVIAEICAHAWDRATEPTARLRAAGFDPGWWPDWDGLATIPVLQKSTVTSLQTAAPPLGGMAAATEGAGCLFLSTGDIMEPDLPAAEARLAAFFRRSGLTADDVVLNGFSYHLTPAGLLFHNALLQIGCRVLPAGPQNADAALTLAVRAGVTGFVGIAGHLKLLLTRAEERGLRVGADLPLRIAFAGGEPFGGPIRAALTERHGVACFDYYGSADLGVVAGECPGQPGFALFDGVVAEILDPQTGARLPDGAAGHLVLSVDNPNYPMLRLGTGDIAAIGADGNLLGPYGRVDSSARVRGLLLYERQVQQALGAHPAIKSGQVVVSRSDGRDGLVATLVVAPEGDWLAATAAFQAAFQAACRMSVDSIVPAEVALEGPALRDLRVAQAP